MVERTYQTFIDDLEQHIKVLQMWATKRQDDLPVAAGFIDCAVADLEHAANNARKER